MLPLFFSQSNRVLRRQRRRLMRLAVQLDDDLRSHALLGLHAHAGIFSVKEMDALKHVEERQAATSLDGAVGGNALGLLQAMLLKQMRADFFAHTDAVVLDDDLQTVIGLESPNMNRKRLGLALRVLDAVFEQRLQDKRRHHAIAHLKVDIDFEVRDCMVPPFILQPLLENCIKHAQRETEPLSIHVRAFETDDGLEIIVEDDGIGMSEEVCAHLFEQHRLEEPESIAADGSVKRGCGLALFNVLQRIHFFYGEDSGMRVKSQEGVGTQVIVELNGEPHEPAPLTA